MKVWKYFIILCILSNVFISAFQKDIGTKEIGFNELKLQEYLFMISTYELDESMAAVLNVFLIVKDAALINGQTTVIV